MRIVNNPLSSSSMDEILAALVNTNTTNRTLVYGGTNKPPGPAGNNSLLTLAGRGWNLLLLLIFNFMKIYSNQFISESNIVLTEDGMQTTQEEWWFIYDFETKNCCRSNSRLYAYSYSIYNSYR